MWRAGVFGWRRRMAGGARGERFRPTAFNDGCHGRDWPGQASDGGLGPRVSGRRCICACVCTEQHQTPLARPTTAFSVTMAMSLPLSEPEILELPTPTPSLSLESVSSTDNSLPPEDTPPDSPLLADLPPLSFLSSELEDSISPESDPSTVQRPRSTETPRPTVFPPGLILPAPGYFQDYERSTVPGGGIPTPFNAFPFSIIPTELVQRSPRIAVYRLFISACGPVTIPSEVPSKGPSDDPSKSPSDDPSKDSSEGPSKNPSEGPSKEPPEDPSKDSSKDSSEGPDVPAQQKNHWLIYVQPFGQRPDMMVLINVQGQNALVNRGQPGTNIQILVSEITFNPLTDPLRNQFNKVNVIDLVPGLSLYDIFDKIHNHGFHCYDFTVSGRGNRYWVACFSEMLRLDGVTASLQQQDDLLYCLKRTWFRGTEIENGAPVVQGMFYPPDSPLLAEEWHPSPLYELFYKFAKLNIER